MGFVGVNLAEELISRGEEVLIATRRRSLEKRPAIAARLRSLGAGIHVADSLWSLDLEGLGGDVYYYLPGTLTGGLKAMMEAHVNLLKHVIGVLEPLKPRLVLVSSIAALGVPRGGGECIVYEEEEHLAGDREYPSLHMETKALGEKVLIENERLLGGWSIIRPGVVYGPWGYHAEWRLLSIGVKTRIGPRLGRGIPHIYSRDLAKILADAGEGVYDGFWVNAVDPLHPDIWDIFNSMCRVLGRRCMGVPVWGLVAMVGRIAPRTSPLKLFYSLLKRRCRYMTRRVRNLDWTPLEDQARGYLEWLKGI